MKPHILRKVVVGALAIACAAVISSRIRSGNHLVQAHANEPPQVIEVKAKKFEFTPSTITLKAGQPVVLRLTTEDRTHGFFLKPLHIDADIEPGKATDVAVTPDAAGEYVVICDHYCGIGHGNMKLTLNVVQ